MSVNKLAEEVEEELREYVSRLRLKGYDLLAEGNYEEGKKAFRLAEELDKFADQLREVDV